MAVRRIIRSRSPPRRPCQVRVPLMSPPKPSSRCSERVTKKKRNYAEIFALHILRTDAVSRHTVLELLQLWGFHLNQSRKNVMPLGMDGVKSDTFGLVHRRDGTLIDVCAATSGYPNVAKVLATWCRQQAPTFPFTSICVNAEYAARIHRDDNNTGPSAVATFGNFSDGRFRLWLCDDGRAPLSELSQESCEIHDARRQLVFFDGKKAHDAQSFVGERYSVVYFTAARYQDAPDAVWTRLQMMGINRPTRPSLAKAWTLVEAQYTSSAALVEQVQRLSDECARLKEQVDHIPRRIKQEVDASHLSMFLGGCWLANACMLNMSQSIKAINDVIEIRDLDDGVEVIDLTIA